MINLNDESFDSKQGTLIFNNGTPGLVENVIISVDKKKGDDKPKSPDYKLAFTDEKGGVANMPFWFITEATQYKTVEELVKGQGKAMKHILHAMLGEATQLPSFNNAEEMLNGCMKMIHEACKSGIKYKVYTNYGTPDYPKSFIQVRPWVPFMQSMISELETLKASTIENMVRLASDKDTSDIPAGSTPAPAGDDWD